jgi:nucleoside-diphosphate-sugar epimerase
MFFCILIYVFTFIYTVDYMGNSNVIEQAGILGVERIILVTSVGCGDTRGAIGEQVYKVQRH